MTPTVPQFVVLFLFEARVLAHSKWILLSLAVLSATAGAFFGAVGRVSPNTPIWGWLSVAAVSALVLTTHQASRSLRRHVARLHPPTIITAGLVSWSLTAFVVLGVEAVIYFGVAALFHPLKTPGLGITALCLLFASALGISVRLYNRLA